MVKFILLLKRVYCPAFKNIYLYIWSIYLIPQACKPAKGAVRVISRFYLLWVINPPPPSPFLASLAREKIQMDWVTGGLAGRSCFVRQANSQPEKLRSNIDT